jgi:2-polyprenyl-3-methyl-5-hydroxy-6-metoxy-1,4-benzoquinol methylase
MALGQGQQRIACLICANRLESSETFHHRDVDYFACAGCGHIQSKLTPPVGYPEKFGVGFSDVYPALNESDYVDRRNRIYKPKVDWALSCHQELGRTREELLGARWFEIGCGAGYFLSALKEEGAESFRGTDADERLVNNAQSVLGKRIVSHLSLSPAVLVEHNEADVYAAFFVLEHLYDPRSFFEALQRRKAGTVLLFSVPTFGLATILESAFDTHSARNLDGVMHTQLYTDESIRRAMNLSGFEIAAQWVFGQDSVDFQRLLLRSLDGKYGLNLRKSSANKLQSILDPFQTVLDRHGLADSRHVLAIKR